MSRNKHYESANNMMTKSGAIHIIIERVLYEPNNIRSTDWN